MPDLTYAELFAGAGGMSLGLEAAGWHCVAHAEIEPHARAVLRKRWPDTALLGDVAQIDGRQFRGITMLTGGSPCQDLSIAGKRAGMQDGTRSSLFFEQVRIWRESEAPLMLWENVVGAFSSHGGKDFAKVIEAIVGAGVDVPVWRAKRGWSAAGRISGPSGSAIWRTLYLQYFATPQRRRRVFVLGVRAGAYGTRHLQAIVDGLLGDSSAGGEAREGATPDAGRSVAGNDGKHTITFQNSGDIGNRSISIFDEVHPTLRCSTSSDGGVGVLTYDARGNGDGVAYAVRTANTNANGHGIAKEVTHTLDGAQGQAVVVLRQREGKPGGGKGPLLSEGQSLTLGTSNDQVVFTRQSSVGVPRRLMPVECERLQGWPDQHTAHGIDEKGREYALKDTPRYKLCGNGIGSPVTAWLGWQIRTAVDTPP